MLRCVDYHTGKDIGEAEDWFVQAKKNEYEMIHDGYTYSLNYVVNNVAFFINKHFNSILENNFSYHPPKEGQSEKYDNIRCKAKELAYLINDLAPKSRENSLAMTNLEQAVFWANAGIARNE
ncbi:Acb2/Tad1 domain-containing protein [Paenibacillus pini]|uniref:Acb2/Tad1 hairpin domain-containing protein n=1 Tax=Paenibacillus pini JCM 16418 TaxID=1236976 RepID=W7Z1B7_9BACL|nr:hypothetical protein [Paenibacillus pini]GAF10786.1 hypothetical protein JCM16418_5007 [Paenibacillus pini JCM 16418]